MLYWTYTSKQLIMFANCSEDTPEFVVGINAETVFVGGQRVLASLKKEGKV